MLFLFSMFVFQTLAMMKPLAEMSQFDRFNNEFEQLSLILYHPQPGSYSIELQKRFIAIYEADEESETHRIGVMMHHHHQDSKKVWHLTEQSHLRYGPFYIGSGRLLKKNPQHFGWMNVKMEVSENMAQDIQLWIHTKTKAVYIQAKESNYWLSKLPWSDDLFWLDSYQPTTAFRIFPKHNFRQQIDEIQKDLIQFS